MSPRRHHWLLPSIPCFSVLLAVFHVALAEEGVAEHVLVDKVDVKRAAPQMYSFGLGKKSLDAAGDDGGSWEPDEAEIVEAAEDKRESPRFAFGLGKRGTDEWDRYSFGLGKRDREVNRFAFGLGKREPARFAFGLGKRASAARFNFGLGKRNELDPEFEDYIKRRFSFGLGKRTNDARARIYAFGLGHRKRSLPADDAAQRSE